MKPILHLFALGLAGAACAGGHAAEDAEFYQQEGTDPAWSTIMEHNLIPIGENSTAGITGSAIRVNRELVGQAPHADRPADRPFEQNIRIHTLGNSAIPRRDFHKWSRWYQEDGNTQVFRLFEGEHNVRNNRENSARIEAFSGHRWRHGDGWQEWEGTVTLVNPTGSIFQIKAPGPVDWPLMITSGGTDRVNIQRRRGERTTVTTGRQFQLKVRDNGLDYEVYIDGELKATGSYDRRGLHSTFRWGMYVGGRRKPAQDHMILYTGATITPAAGEAP